MQPIHRLLLAVTLGAAPILAQCATPWSPLGSGLDDLGWTLASMPDGSIVVGGDFLHAGGTPVGYLARWSPGAGWSTLGSGVDDGVRGLAVTTNGDLFASGWFTHAGGVATNRIARWNGTAWSSLGSGLGNGIGNVLLPEANGSLLVGGMFATAGGLPVNHVARWNGSAWSALGSGIPNAGVVRALAVAPNGDIFAGGLLSVPGSLGIARFDGTTWGPVGSGVSGTGFTVVLALQAMPNGDVIAAGAFTSAGGVPVNGIARWDGTNWSPLGSGVDGLVNTMLRLPDGDLVVGGNFTTAGGVSTPFLARWNGSVWSSMDAGLDAAVEALALRPDGDLVVAGRFTTAALAPAAFIARRSTSCPANAASFGTGCVGAGGMLTLAATNPPWLGGTCRAQATGLPFDALAIGAFGFGQQAMPMPMVHPLGVPGCTLLVTDEILLHVPVVTGGAATALAIPGTAALVGATFHHQVVVVERDAFGHVAAVTGSNGLSFTIGAL